MSKKLEEGDHVRVKTDYEGIVEFAGQTTVRVADSSGYYGTRIYAYRDLEKVSPSLPTATGSVIRTAANSGYVWLKTDYGWRASVDKDFTRNDAEVIEWHNDLGYQWEVIHDAA